jgi:hypothetical protein
MLSMRPDIWVFMIRVPEYRYASLRKVRFMGSEFSLAMVYNVVIPSLFM